MTRGAYLVLEGGDATGKSRQAEGLAAWLRERGHTVQHLREPGSTSTGEALRHLLLDPETGTLLPISEALLFSAARAEMVRQEVEPALARGEVVLVERCFVSTYVYQGVAAGVAMDFLRDVTAAVHGPTMPDRIFVLDVDEQTRRERADGAGKADRFESREEAFHARVRQGYLDVAAAEPRAEVVDARPTADLVQAMLRERIATILVEAGA